MKKDSWHLIDPQPATLPVLSKVSLHQHLAWTPPTLSGAKLYIRDRRTLMALDQNANEPSYAGKGGEL